MAGVIAILCPQCGASLKVDRDAATATCDYCGTTSQVQRRSRILQIPVRTAPPPGQPSYPVARQVRSRSSNAGAVVSLLAVIGGGVGVYMCLTRNHLFGGGDRSWDSSRPLLYDVNGDGVMDVLGRSRYVRSGDTVHMIAIDGKDGSTLWESGSLGPRGDHYQDPLAIAGNVLLQGDQQGGVSGWDVIGGKRTWRVDLGERVAAMCAGDAAHVVIETKDKRRHLIDLSDGKRSDAPAGDCVELGTDAPGIRGHDIFDVHRAGIDDIPIPGMHAESFLDRPGTSAVLVIGRRSPGTGVPMAALVDGNKVVWSTVIPEKPLAASESAPEQSAWVDDVLVVVYALDDPTHGHRYRLASFATTTGLRRWDVAMPDGFMDVVAGLSVAGSRVYLSIWGRLEGMDLATGKHLYTVGR